MDGYVVNPSFAHNVLAMPALSELLLSEVVVW